MIDIEKEARQFANKYGSYHRTANEEIVKTVIALCRRGVAEALEDAAKVCDAIGADYRRKAERVVGGGVSELHHMKNGAAECAAAIRSRKEQEERSNDVSLS